jgi:hypothetical protein
MGEASKRAVAPCLLFLFYSSPSRKQRMERIAGASTAAHWRADLTRGKGVSEMRTGETHRFYCFWCKRMVWALFAGHGWICSECARPIT